MTSHSVAQEMMNEVVFEKEIPCTVLLPHQEDRLRSLRLRITLATRGLQRCYIFRLTDDSSLSFLYGSVIEEAEFPRVKELHHLNVDFNGFANFVTGFFDKARSLPNWSARFAVPRHVPDVGSPGLQQAVTLSPASASLLPGMLRTGSSGPTVHPESCVSSGVLTIIERDEYCDYPRYTLAMNAGTHAQIQEYLSALVVDLRRRNEESVTSRLETDALLQALQIRLDQVLAEKTMMQQDLDKIKGDNETRTSALVNAIRSECNEKIESLTFTHEEQRRRLEDALRAELLDARSKLDQWMNRGTELQSASAMSDARLRELGSINESLRRQLDASLADCENLRKDLQTVKMKLFDSEVQLRDLEKRESVLAQQVSSGAENTSTLKELLDTANARTRDVEQGHAATKEMLQRNEEMLRKATEEIHRANEIIKKKNAQMEALKAKVETKSQIAREQDARLTRLQDDAREATNERMRLVAQLRDKDVLTTELRGQLERSCEELKKSRELLEESRRVQQWLTSELNRSQMAPLKGPIVSNTSYASTDVSGAAGSVAFSPPPVSAAGVSISRPVSSGRPLSEILPPTTQLADKPYKSPAEYARLAERFLSPSMTSFARSASTSGHVAGDADAISAEYLPRPLAT
jgi:hypothetical protein